MNSIIMVIKIRSHKESNFSLGKLESQEANQWRVGDICFEKKSRHGLSYVIPQMTVHFIFCP